jgi:hypothetical protein
LRCVPTRSGRYNFSMEFSDMTTHGNHAQGKTAPNLRVVYCDDEIEQVIETQLENLLDEETEAIDQDRDAWSGRTPAMRFSARLSA